ncbi:tripartite tricarboxylate transporter substrate binding protein [Paenibacillus naphthalenovorans]|uniref:tripartite tricarboxylate transporter substrate binding protein n=1 Tax=Paenibacillus naphthalenovorans TaxID=162209 RepID=UPI0010B27651|nr:tripartite tricarboxylate transporter substrate binding protein [Paenibacillus naphthalenovorans]GCL71135.1 tripartite tricarboxylate transporter substrate binding protein [Paenibacillus naphthalenovorans]
MKKTFVAFAIIVLTLGALIGCTPRSSNDSTDAAGKGAAGTQQIDWPNKPIKLIVPFAASGGTDLGARLLASYLEKDLGVPVVVENKVGAAGWVAYADLVNAKPDGYTLGVIVNPALITGYINPSANRKENLDSFEHIINHGVDEGLIAVRPDDKRFATINDLIEYAKNNEISVTSNGIGSSNHLIALSMNKELGTKFRFVQFGGTGEAIASVLGGHVDVLIGEIGGAIDQVHSGQLKALSVFGPERNPKLPDVPTMKEKVGFENSIIYASRGIAGPKGIDPQIIAKLQSAIEKAETNPEFINKASELGMKVDLTKGDAYIQLLKKQEAAIMELKTMLGW